MTSTDLAEYDKVKQFLLSEFRLTPKEYKSRFDNANKTSEETFVRFTSRLHNLLTYYLRSRDVTTFDALCQLIVSDKLKSCLSASVLNYIRSLEGDDWFDPGKIASLADTYVANHDIRLNNPRPSVPRAASPRKGPPANVAPQQSWRSYPGQSVVPFRPRFDRGRGTGHSEQSYRPRKECFRCGSLNHLSFHCPQNNRGNYHGNGQRFQNPTYRSDKSQVNTCNMVPQAIPECQSANEPHVVQENKVEVAPEATWEYAKFPEVDAINSEIPEPGPLKISPLKFVEVIVEGIPITAMKDSGAQIPLVSREVVEKHHIETFGGVTIQGVVGEAVRAPLATLGIQVATEDGSQNLNPKLPIVCGVVDFNSRDYDVILPSSVVRELLDVPVVSVGASITECVNNDVVESVDDVNESGDVRECINVDDVLSVDMKSDSESDCDVNQLVAEQKADPLLESCWMQAKECKGNFVIYRGLLYHQDKVEGQSVSQLCVPRSRRDKVMKLAHDSIFGDHMGERKTRERIRLSFYWPRLKPDVRDYTMSCEACQLRS